VLVEAVIALVIIVVLAVAATAYFLLNATARVRRGLRRPAMPIADATLGSPIKITGRVQLNASPVEDVLGNSCVYVRIAVLHFFRRKSTDGNISEAWKPVFEEHRGSAFDVVDDSGRVRVDARGAESVIDEQWKDVDWDNLSAPEAELIARYETMVERGKPAKIRQTVIREGEQLSVFGTPSPGTDTGAALVFAAKGDALFGIGP